MFFVSYKKGGSFLLPHTKEFPGCLVSCPSEGDNWMYVNRYPEGDGWSVQLRC